MTRKQVVKRLSEIGASDEDFLKCIKQKQLEELADKYLGINKRFSKNGGSIFLSVLAALIVFAWMSTNFSGCRINVKTTGCANGNDCLRCYPHG